MSTYLYSYNPNSQGCRELARALGIRRLRHEGTKTLVSSDTIINWGSSSLPSRVNRCRHINAPSLLSKVTDKLAFFERMKDVRLENDKRITPLHWTNRNDALAYLRNKGGAIVCRTMLSASGGRGIVIAEQASDLVECKLYTRYIPKKDEYRIHILDGKVIDLQRKAKRLDAGEVDWKVRNHDNGFVFVRENVKSPKSVLTVAQKAMEESKLDFGAVDVVYNDQNSRAYVLEINTAPGLEGQTVVNYARAFREYLNK